MLRARHALRLVADVVGYARAERAWWLLPVAVAVATVSLVTGTVQVAVPTAIYTLF